MLQSTSMIIKDIHRRSKSGPNHAERAEAEGKAQRKVIERIADTAILCYVGPPVDQPTENLVSMMNNGRRTVNGGTSLMSSVKVEAEGLLAARGVLEDRIARAQKQHEQIVGTKSEANSAASTKAAIIILRNAIRYINQELPEDQSR